MKDKTYELFEVNSDILVLLRISNEIGWQELRESSIHRILYLSSVLYTFMNHDADGAYSNYHFSLSETGPYSDIIEKALTNLKTKEIIIEDESGNLTVDFSDIEEKDMLNSNKKDWFKIVIYILGLYGESKIFGFVIQDPQYKSDFQRNAQTELDISDKNKTVETLKHFKKAFEKTLKNVNEIEDKEYLELYFEYVFGIIIKKED